MWTDTTLVQYVHAKLTFLSNFTDAEWVPLEQFFPSTSLMGRSSQVATQADILSGHFRHVIKVMIQALINDRRGGKPEQIKLPDLSFKP